MSLSDYLAPKRLWRKPLAFHKDSETFDKLLVNCNLLIDDNDLIFTPKYSTVGTLLSRDHRDSKGLLCTDLRLHAPGVGKFYAEHEATRDMLMGAVPYELNRGLKTFIKCRHPLRVDVGNGKYSARIHNQFEAIRNGRPGKLLVSLEQARIVERTSQEVISSDWKGFLKFHYCPQGWPYLGNL